MRRLLLPIWAERVGNHALTGYVQADFAAHALDLVDICPEHPHLPTLAAVLTDRRNGDRTIVTNPRHAAALDLAALERGFDPTAQVILVDGFYLEAAIRLAAWGRRQGIPVVMDGGSWKTGMEELIPYVDLAICSADFHLPDTEEPIFSWFRRKGLRFAAITQGEKPIRFMAEEREGLLPVAPVPVVDTLGAGDVFHGAFCYYFAQSGDFEACLQQASVIAGRSCRYLGARGWMRQDV
jgi:sugar/nucleoside kinase (ribokinase family)